jgi:hypothetical protein
MSSRQADAAVRVVLRLRVCLHCLVLFCICRRCDRGQRYCSAACSASALREQRRQANRRHQQTDAGRQDHRDRQRIYRKRCAQRRWASSGVMVQAPGLNMHQEDGEPCPRTPISPSIENVTDKSSPALLSSRMISGEDSGSEDSGSVAAVERGGCAAQPRAAGVFARPTTRRDRQARFPLLLRCAVCGCQSRFVDPFPRCMRL